MILLTLFACGEMQAPEMLGDHLGVLNRGPVASCEEDGEDGEVSFRWEQPPLVIGDYIVETRAGMALWAPTDEWTTTGEGVDEIVAVRCQPDELVRVSWWGL